MLATAEAPFSLPPLPYAANALEPWIDAETMNIHHGRHHKAYVDNLNAQVANFPELAGMSLEAMQAAMSKFNVAVRNNGGGHYNHDLFWQVMAPAGKGGEPSAALTAAIERRFGSLEAMKTEMNRAAAGQFGSGWAWLIVGADGELAITATANQDNPLMDVVPVRGAPVLGVDVWEHAYYLKYQNRRGAYLDAWWNVVNWAEVSRRYETATAGLKAAKAR
ncbi:MAG: superoxide dismutase [Steroidobacteraceae bacterium]|nr:superoxide dismutase [Steroidobacteraceae bacterium]